MKVSLLDRRWSRALFSVAFSTMLIHCDEPMDEAAELDALIADEAAPVDDVRAPAADVDVDVDAPLDEFSGGQPVAVGDDCVSWGWCLWRGDDGVCIAMMSCHTTLKDFEENHCNESCGWELD